MLIGNRFGTRSAPVQAPVVVYGTRWCAASQMVRRYLDRKGIPYRFVDLEQDPLAAAQVRWVAGGTVSHPRSRWRGKSWSNRAWTSWDGR